MKFIIQTFVCISFSLAVNSAIAQSTGCPPSHPKPCTQKSPEYYEALAEMRMARLQARQLRQDTVQIAAPQTQRPSNGQSQSKPSGPDEVILPKGRRGYLMVDFQP